MGEHQRNAEFLVVQGPTVAGVAVIPQGFAVVAGEHDQGLLAQSPVVQCLQ